MWDSCQFVIQLHVNEKHVSPFFKIHVQKVISLEDRLFLPKYPYLLYSFSLENPVQDFHCPVIQIYADLFHR